MEKWIDLEMINKQSAAEIVVELMADGFKLSDWIIDISLSLTTPDPAKL